MAVADGPRQDADTRLAADAASVNRTGPAEVLPAEVVPVEVLPAEVVPADTMPVEVAPVEVVPIDAVPIEAVPAEAEPAADAGDVGDALVEFILVGTLLLFLFLGILQVGLVLHIRNTLAADAAEGARHGANLGVPASDGGPYAQELIARTIPGRADTVCTGAQVDGPGGTPLVEVTCTVRVPLVLVPLGDGVTIKVTGHALKELP